MPFRSAGLAQQAGFALGLGVWLTLAMWVVARVPWAGVFGLGTALGWVLLDYWLVLDAECERRGEVAELEKQVVSLRAAMSRMAVHEIRTARASPSPRMTGRAVDVHETRTARAASRVRKSVSSELLGDSSGHSGGSRPRSC